MTLPRSDKPNSPWISAWLKIGRRNPWIKHAYDPDFDETSFAECSDLDDLKARLAHGNWCIGTAFFLGDLCFIQQVEGGDEWLVIRRDVDFESVCAERMIETGSFDDHVRRWLGATDEQLRKLAF